MAARSEAWLCSGLPAEIVGSNHAWGMYDFCAVGVVCCANRGLCDELITHPEEYYRMWRLVVCDLETSKISHVGPQRHKKNLS